MDGHVELFAERHFSVISSKVTHGATQERIHSADRKQHQLQPIEQSSGGGLPFPYQLLTSVVVLHLQKDYTHNNNWWVYTGLSQSNVKFCNKLYDILLLMLVIPWLFLIVTVKLLI